MTYVRALLLDLAEAALARTPLASRHAVASACGMSATTLSRAIKDAHGQRFRDWQQRILLARAKALMMDGARPRCLKEAAMELGFASQQSFSRWFRKETGVTPSIYRAQHDATRESRANQPGCRRPLFPV